MAKATEAITGEVIESKEILFSENGQKLIEAVARACNEARIDERVHRELRWVKWIANLVGFTSIGAAGAALVYVFIAVPGFAAEKAAERLRNDTGATKVLQAMHEKVGQATVQLELAERAIAEAQAATEKLLGADVAEIDGKLKALDRILTGHKAANDMLALENLLQGRMEKVEAGLARASEVTKRLEQSRSAVRAETRGTTTEYVNLNENSQVAHDTPLRDTHTILISPSLDIAVASPEHSIVMIRLTCSLKPGTDQNSPLPGSIHDVTARFLLRDEGGRYVGCNGNAATNENWFSMAAFERPRNKAGEWTMHELVAVAQVPPGNYTIVPALVVQKGKFGPWCVRNARVEAILGTVASAP